MSRNCLDIRNLAVFHTDKVPIAHERHIFAIDSDNAVYYVAGIIDKREHDIANAYAFGFHEHHAFLSAHNERPHAAPRNRERDTHALAHKLYRLGNYLRIVNHLLSPFTVSKQSLAASSSGRHSKCQTFTPMASAFSVACKPSATARSQRFPEMLGTSAA